MPVPDFLLPDLGEGLTEAEVIEWHVQVGDQVTTDQPVVEVETAKAAVEVPVPFAGTVTALHADPGTMVAVGQPLITVGPAPEETSGNVLIGYGTRPSSGARRRRRRRPADHSTGPVRVISPLVRKLARDAGLDLTAISGSGPSGVIRRADIEQAAQGRPADATATTPPAPLTSQVPQTTAAPPTTLAPATTPAPPTTPAASGSGDAGATRIPLRGTRRAVADKLTRSRREIPEATVWVDVDATGLLATRALLNAKTPDQPVSLLALFARFTVLALRRYPELNAHLDGDEIVIPGHVHLGFAAQTDRGLVVPVVRDAHQLPARDLSAALTALTAAARSGQLSPAGLTGGTITVNNYGVFGVDGSAAIINHPEVAIIGLGRIIDRPWVVDGQLAVRKVTELTLAFDHRVCDGGTAGGFLRTLADYLEDPVTALGDL